MTRALPRCGNHVFNHHCTCIINLRKFCILPFVMTHLHPTPELYFLSATIPSFLATFVPFQWWSCWRNLLRSYQTLPTLSFPPFLFRPFMYDSKALHELITFNGTPLVGLCKRWTITVYRWCGSSLTGVGQRDNETPQNPWINNVTTLLFKHFFTN